MMPLKFLRTRILGWVRDTRKDQPFGKKASEYNVVSDGKQVFDVHFLGEGMVAQKESLEKDTVNNYFNKEPKQIGKGFKINGAEKSEIDSEIPEEANLTKITLDTKSFLKGISKDNFEAYLNGLGKALADKETVEEIMSLGKGIDGGQIKAEEVTSSKSGEYTGLDKILGVLTQIWNIWFDWNGLKNDPTKTEYDTIVKHYKFHRCIPEKSDNDASMSMMCLNPGICFREITKIAPRSIVLTSGTLTPFNSYESELEIPFDIKFTGTHVIDSTKQITANVIKSLPRCPMLFDWKNRDSYDLKHGLGVMLNNSFRHIPNGILVFFPSYMMMNSYIDSWQNDRSPRVPDAQTTWESFLDKKEICKETKNPQWFKTNFDKYMENYASDRGAVFFAVFGGKLSEGIDFTDKMARAVMVIGIPFPNWGDLRVQAKREYLNDIEKSYKNSKLVSIKSMNGKEWYSAQATRATNQAVGRSIRHIDDFGAILFLDQRWSYSDNRNGLSSWVLDVLKNYEKFPQIFPELVRFFKETPTFVADRKQ